MTFTLTVLDLTERGVQCALNDNDAPFWIPRRHPAVVWSAPPEPGETVTVRLPPWLVQKHQQLTALRHQMGLAFHQPPALDPAQAEGQLPMADYPEDAGKGFLARNDRREKPSQPEFNGKLSIHGTEYRLAAWVREKDGKKFFSIAVREIAEQPSKPRPAATSQAFDDSTIPF